MSLYAYAKRIGLPKDQSRQSLLDRMRASFMRSAKETGQPMPVSGIAELRRLLQEPATGVPLTRTYQRFPKDKPVRTILDELYDRRRKYHMEDILEYPGLPSEIYFPEHIWEVLEDTGVYTPPRLLPWEQPGIDWTVFLEGRK